MLPRQHRFRSRQEIRRVLAKGKRIKTEIGTLIVLRNQTDEQQSWKAAVIVGKKVARKATDRNAIRRQCYEALWQFHAKIPNSIELIILPRFGENKPSQQGISQALKTALLVLPVQTDPAATN